MSYFLLRRRLDKISSAAIRIRTGAVLKVGVGERGHASPPSRP